MTTTIYKYPLSAPLVDFDIPVGGIIRHTEAQAGVPTLWIEHPYPVDGMEAEKRTFISFGTGHPIDGGLKFVGTVTGVDGWMVFHIFEKLS